VEGKRLPFAERGGRHRARDHAHGGLRLVHSAELPLMTLIKGHVEPAAEILGLAGGTLRHAARRCHRDRSRLTLGARIPPSSSRNARNAVDEARLQGRVVRTIVAGRTVYEYV